MDPPRERYASDRSRCIMAAHVIHTRSVSYTIRLGTYTIHHTRTVNASHARVVKYSDIFVQSGLEINVGT